MSFQIHLRGPGLNMISQIKDSALNDLLTLLHANRDEEAGPMHWPEGPRGGPRPPGPPPPPRPGEPCPPPRGPDDHAAHLARKQAKRKLSESAEMKSAITKLAGLTSAPLAEHADLNFPEKLLLLGAWMEAKKEKFIVRGPLLSEAFSQSGQTPPANPKRDVMAAVQSGWLTLGMYPNPNRAMITPEGWQRIADILSD